MFQLPRLYPILDPSCFPGREALLAAAEHLSAAGCPLLQYRNKSGAPRQIIDDSKALTRLFGNTVQRMMNDRPDLALIAGFHGVHVGHDDLSPAAARTIVGPSRWVGLSTHNPDQVAQADLTSADYIAIGPVFPTASKANPDPVIGLEGVSQARALTRKPLVAIGGITRANCRAVIDAGADSVAVISALLPDPRKSAEEFLRVLG
jgi:thiamine-phosphate pyrophosphorylase